MRYARKRSAQRHIERRPFATRALSDLATKLPSEVKPVVIDGATHFFLDLYGEEAADAIAKFLKE